VEIAAGTSAQANRMKMKATIDVEFEVNEGGSQMILKDALARGVSDLLSGIAVGVAMRNITRVRPGSVRAVVGRQEFFE